MTNALSNALAIMPFMIRIYSFCDPITQLTLTKVSTLWKQVPVIFQFKKSAEERVRALNEVLQVKLTYSFENAFSVEHIQIDLHCYRLNVLNYVSPEVARYAILPIELKHPYSYFIQKAVFSVIRSKTIEALYKCYQEMPERCIEKMSKETLNKLSEGFVQEALLFLDLAQSLMCLEPLLDLTFSGLLHSNDYPNAITILEALSMHPISKQMTKKYIELFMVALEQPHAEHPLEDPLMRGYRDAISRIYQRLEKKQEVIDANTVQLLPSKNADPEDMQKNLASTQTMEDDEDDPYWKSLYYQDDNSQISENLASMQTFNAAFNYAGDAQNNQAVAHAEEDENDELLWYSFDEPDDWGNLSEIPEPLEAINDAQEGGNGQHAKSLFGQNDHSNFSANLTPLEAYNRDLNRAGVDFDQNTYHYLRDTALSIQPYMDSIKALGVLLKALRSGEFKYLPWIDEIEDHLGINFDEDDYLIPGDEDLVNSQNYDADSVFAESLHSLEHLEASSQGPQEMLNLLQLMNLSTDEWKQRKFSALNARIKHYCSQFTIPNKPTQNYALLEKQDLNIGDSIAVVGDLHGNGLRFDLTLKSLQNLGFLDTQFHLLAGKYLVLLGDYMDRGENNLKVIEILMALKMENQHQVFLVRGNHEDISQNTKEFYTPRKTDPLYRSYLANANNTALLSEFYNLLPDAVYLGQKNAQTNEYQYAQYCHGLFHMYTDPHPLLAEKQPHALSWITFSESFSPRIQKIHITPSQTTDQPHVKKIDALDKLKHLSSIITPKLQNLHWFDIGDAIGNLNTGRETIPPIYPKAYLRLYSTQDIKIKEIFRGHQKGDLWRSAWRKIKPLLPRLTPL